MNPVGLELKIPASSTVKVFREQNDSLLSATFSLFIISLISLSLEVGDQKIFSPDGYLRF